MSIASDQDLPANIRLRRGVAQTYYLAKWSSGLQLVVSVLVPIAVSMIGIFFVEFRPYAAIVALAALGLDVLWLDRSQKALLKQAAKISERFDCSVLLLEWNRSIVGAEISAATIESLDEGFRTRGRSDDKLLGWYPAEASRAPFHQGRVICQLTNAQYDGRLRRRYRQVIMTFVIVILVLLATAGLAVHLSLADFVITIFVPATPLVGWSLREFFRQLDTDKPLHDIQNDALELWGEAKVGLSESQCALRSRALQDAIYVYRTGAPLPIPLIYSVLRKRLEEKMNNSAAVRLKEIGLE